jgi:hypothetical protein
VPAGGGAAVDVTGGGAAVDVAGGGAAAVVVTWSSGSGGPSPNATRSVVLNRLVISVVLGFVLLTRST